MTNCCDKYKLSCTGVTMDELNHNIDLLRQQIDCNGGSQLLLTILSNIRCLLSNQVTVADTATVDMDMDDESVISANVKKSTQANNALQLTSTGVFAPDTTYTGVDTNSVDTTVTQPSTTGGVGTVKADVKISTTAGNSLSIDGTGVFGHDTTYVASDTSSVDMTVTQPGSAAQSGTISAVTKISSSSGNGLTIKSDGLYVNQTASETTHQFAVLESIGTFTKTGATLTHNDDAVVKIVNADSTVTTITPTITFTDRTIGSIDWSIAGVDGALSFLTVPSSSATTSGFTTEIRPGEVIVQESGTNPSRVATSKYMQVYVSGSSKRFLVTLGYYWYVSFADQTSALDIYIDNAMMISSDSNNFLSLGSDGSLFYTVQPDAATFTVTRVYDNVKITGNASTHQAMLKNSQPIYVDKARMERVAFNDEEVTIAQIDNSAFYPTRDLTIMGTITGCLDLASGIARDLSITVTIKLYTDGHITIADSSPFVAPYTFQARYTSGDGALHNLPVGSNTLWYGNVGGPFEMADRVTVILNEYVWACSYTV